MPPCMMLVFCLKRQAKAIMDEYQDWQPEGLHIKLYGITKKASNGFILIEWQKPVPERFIHKLKEDEDILDFLTYDPTLQPVVPA